MGVRVELPGEIEELRGRIVNWRAGKVSAVERMPEALWAEALGWARSFGASAVSRALGIGYVGLHQRLGVAGESERDVEPWLRSGTTWGSKGEHRERSEQAVPPFMSGAERLGGSFVELSGCPGSLMLVEMDRSDGCRLRLQVHPGVPFDAAGILRAFLGQAR